MNGCTRFPIMQPVCVSCLMDHDVKIVPDISYGIIGCQWCGYIPPVFFSKTSYEMAVDARQHRADYRKALRVRFGTDGEAGRHGRH